MIPGLDWLLRWRMAQIGGPASAAKAAVLGEATLDWITAGRPRQTVNARLAATLLARWQVLHPPGTIRSVTAGQPGFYLPSTAPAPTFAALSAMRPPRVQINPLATWPVADWVPTVDVPEASWTGFDWVVKP